MGRGREGGGENGRERVRLKLQDNECKTQREGKTHTCTVNCKFRRLTCKSGVVQ